MRLWLVLLCVVVAGVSGGLGGNYLAVRWCNEEFARLTQERDLSRVREGELRAQLEDALTARETLAQEVQKLQTDLSERLKRLEEIATQQAPTTQVESSARGEGDQK